MASRVSSIARSGWKHGVVEQHRLALRQAQFAAGLAGIAFAVILVFEMARNARAGKVRAGVKPGLGERGRHMEGRIEVGGWRRLTRLGEDAKLLGIPLVDPPEAAKLTLDAIEIPMVIRRARDEAVAADEIAGLDPA